MIPIYQVTCRSAVLCCNPVRVRCSVARCRYISLCSVARIFWYWHESEYLLYSASYAKSLLEKVRLCLPGRNQFAVSRFF